MEKTPKISVILPVYNCELYINEAIDSILNQTFSNFELLIIDDKSTDKTVEIIKSYTDDRINLTIKEKNSGYTDSLNWAISIAKGIYIARMDGDDISMPTRFEEQIKVMEENPKIIVCGTNGKVLGTDKLIFRPEFDQDLKLALFDSNPFIHPSVIIRKNLFNIIKYNKLMEPAEDFDLWCKSSELGQFYNIQNPLLEYRIHPKNISIINNIKQIENYIDIKINFFKALNFNTTKFSDELLKKYFNGSQINNYEFKKILNWFNNLKKSNKKLKKFENKRFNLKIDEMANRFIFANLKKNKFYKNIPLIFNLTLIQKINVMKYYYNKI